MDHSVRVMLLCEQESASQCKSDAVVSAGDCITM